MAEKTTSTDAKALTLHFDGGSRGNPGPAGCGVVLSADEVDVVTFGKYVGHATNNVAEYSGLIAGMEAALELGCTHLLVVGDSELVIKQMKGQYCVKNRGLKPLWEEAQALATKFEQVRYDHARREHNQTADRLANLAMDRKRDVEDLP
ncbi:MAG: ribonuclease HI family protein [Planctomycetota bacterium]